MNMLRTRFPSHRSEIAAGCVLCLSLAAPDTVAADAVPSAALASPASSGFTFYREFDRFRAHARFDRAFRLLAANRLADAAREFGAGLALDPDHIAARLGYAQALAKRGAFDASIEQLDALQQRDGAVLPALQLRAQMHAAAGRERAAITDQEAVAVHPSASPAERRFAIETAADLYLRLGRYDQALNALDRLPADRSDAHASPQTLARRALAYEKMQRYGEAEAAYRAAASRAEESALRAQWARSAQVAASMAEGRQVQTVAAALNLQPLDVANARVPGAEVQHPVKADAVLLLHGIQSPRRAVGPPDAGAQARALLDSGEYAVAVKAAQRNLALRKSTAAYQLLAFAQAKAGDWGAAAASYEMVLAQRGLKAHERIEALSQSAYALSQLQRYRESADALDRAVAEEGGNTMALYERLAYARSQAGDIEGVADAQRRALDVPGITDQTRRSILRRLADVQQTLGKKEEVIEAYRSLLALDPDDAQVRLDLGILMRNQGRREEAEPLLAEATNATPRQRKQMLDELGYLHESNVDLARAATAWSDSLAIEKDARIALALAAVQLRAGERGAARGTLQALADVQQPNVQAVRLDMLWTIETADGRHAPALDAAEQALAVQPTPQRRFQAAQSERQLGHLPQAITHLKQAVAEDAKTEYLDALAYSHRAAGSYEEAARTFETLLQRDPQRNALYADLAYTYMRMSDNERALDWFKRAIDKRRERTSGVQLAQAPGAPLPAIERPREDEDIRAMRDEVRKLSETWSLSAYQSLRSSRGDRPSTVSGIDSSGLIPSQGGLELSWRPPVIGLRDERTLDVFARMLWSNEPGSLNIQSASRQAGVGLRFKPLRDQSLYLSIERLIKIGDNAQNDWLLRASYGWVDGYEMRVNQDSWNYTSLFADVGAFTDPLHTRALYVEARQGRSYRFSDRWIVTPHVVANGRRQWPDPGRGNYAEAGAGVSVRYLFNETAYATPRSSAEVLLQYKKGFAAAKSGWLVTTVLRF